MTIKRVFSSIFGSYGYTKATVEQFGGGELAIQHVVIDPPEGATTGNAQGTREYNDALAKRTAVTSNSSQAVEIGALGASREVMFASTVRCYIRFGDNNVANAVVGGAGCFPLVENAMFHRIVPEGTTHFKVIRDSAANGVLDTVPVL